jgi:ferredoxin
MHVLLRGDVLQRLRLASGLVLFTFAGTHFMNHALGLISLELMHQVQEIRTAVTRSTPGSLVLGSALATHISLGLYKLARRRTLRLPRWEAAQIAVALAIPFLLFPHIVNTRIAHAVFGVNDIYLYELARLWPDRAVLQSLLLLLVWTHGCIGMHYWLRLSEGYDRYRPVLWAIAALVPVLALGGFATAGRLTADIMADPAALAHLKERANWPNAVDGDTMAAMRDWSQYLFGTVIAAIGMVYLFRRRRAHAGTAVAVTYRDGPTVKAAPGMTLLETSRAAGIPHASVCGGRARCFTCRVKVDHGLDRLAPPDRAEAVALQALEAPANVRLACQLRPTAPLTVTILHRPAVPGPLQVDFIELKAVIAAHARAVLGHDTVACESCDPHTLGAWFTGELDYPVTVPALDPQRFPLDGGRIDYIEDRPVAAIAFRHDGHPVSLHIMPANDAEAVAVRGNRSGYSVIGWVDGAFAYFAVSDLGRDVLDAMQDAVGAALHPAVATTDRGAAALEDAHGDRSSKTYPDNEVCHD